MFDCFNGTMSSKKLFTKLLRFRGLRQLRELRLLTNAEASYVTILCRDTNKMQDIKEMQEVGWDAKLPQSL